MDITKVLILMDMPLFPYRIYCYNELAKRGVTLTVVSVNDSRMEYDLPMAFEHISLRMREIGPFALIESMGSIPLKDYDLIIITPNLRVLNFYRFYNRNWMPKLIAWGHLTGRTSNNKIAEMIRYRLLRHFPALIFYESGTKEDYIAHNYESQKLFVANNTQYVDPLTVHPNEDRRYFLYVGRIQERKGLDMALRAFAQLKKDTNDESLTFVFVGGGDTSRLKAVAQEDGILNSVSFVGAEHNQAKLGDWFSHALAYVSPGHVGLGVLHSFACGVPVITCSGRLHSVEIYNCNEKNSLVIPYNVDDITEAMRRLYYEKAFQKELSEAAYKHYWEHCTIEKMVDGIDDAIQYVRRTNLV